VKHTALTADEIAASYSHNNDAPAKPLGTLIGFLVFHQQNFKTNGEALAELALNQKLRDAIHIDVSDAKKPAACPGGHGTTSCSWSNDRREYLSKGGC
jgi:hypothetical protein